MSPTALLERPAPAAPAIRPWTVGEQDAHWLALCETVGRPGEQRPGRKPSRTVARPAYPRRVRLHGGRKTHAARDVGAGDRVTACDHFLPGNDPSPNWLDRNEPVTCRECRIRTA